MARPRTRLALAVGLLSFVQARCAAQHSDVLLQLVDGEIVIGSADFDRGGWTLGARVFQRQLLTNFRANDPGFTSLATGNPLLAPGVSGFPPLHDVYFDLLPMSNGPAAGNLLFWNGTDADDNGLTLADVRFGLPAAGVTWNVFDDGFNLFTVDGSNAFVPGGLIQRTSSDTNASDGVDTGTLHQHLLIRVDDGDGNVQTNPPEGVYMVALQARSPGFESSAPFLLVHRTFNLSNAVRDAAAAWADEHYDMLFAPAKLPGDYNGDGHVDAADFVVWRDTHGQTGANPPADGDGNGAVETNDYAIWRANFGAGDLPAGAGQTSALPEPNGILQLALWGIICTYGRVRNRAGRRLSYGNGARCASSQS